MIILKRIKKNDFAVNVLKLISGTALGQMITVLVSPLLARIYAPEDFGLLAVYISIASILSVIISLRYETAVVLPEDDNQAMDLVLLASLVAFVFSILFLKISCSRLSAILNLNCIYISFR
jgi:lipopolysaccharide exporter